MNEEEIKKIGQDYVRLRRLANIKADEAIARLIEKEGDKIYEL